MNRSCYGFEIKKDMYKNIKEKMLINIKTEISNSIEENLKLF